MVVEKGKFACFVSVVTKWYGMRSAYKISPENAEEISWETQA
jgi:hypothetical protein